MIKCTSPRLPLVCLALAAIASPILAGVVFADVQQQLRDNESRQQQLAGDVRTVGQQLDTVLAEFDRNGLGGGPDVAVLKQIRGVLDKLSADQMQKVVECLQSAQTAASVDQASASVRDAHAQQQAIVTQLGLLLIEYQRQQGIQALAARFEKLADREQGAMASTVALAVATAGKPAKDWRNEWKNTEWKNTQQMDRSEQDGINADAKAAFDLLGQLVAADGSGSEQLRKAQALVGDRDLIKQMADASASITQAVLYRAATGQKAVRDAFFDLSDVLTPPRSKSDALRDAKDQLQRLADAQKSLRDDAAATKNSQQLKTQTQLKQGELVDKTDRLQKKLQALATAGADDAKAAMQAMNQARADLAKADKNSAAADQDQALDRLKKAADSLDSEIAKAADPPATQPQDQLAAAQQALDAAQQETKAAAHQMDAGKPQDAGQPLQQAAQQMQQAAAQAGQGVPQDAQQAMQQAAQALQQAAAHAKAAKADPAQQHTAQQQIAQAQQAMAQAAASMAMAQKNEPGSPPAPPSGQPQKSDTAVNAKVDDPKGVNGAQASSGQSAGTAPGGKDAYLGLPKRDRDALTQSQSDKYPQEFAPDIERYLRNLSDTDKK